MIKTTMIFSIFKNLSLAFFLAFFYSGAVSADENCTTIADLVCELDELNTFCEIVSGVNATVDAFTNQVFTLFAPTDEAWLDLDVMAIDNLVNCTGALNSVFAFHTVYGEEITSSDLVCKETIEMANGDDSRTVCRDGRVYQKGTSNSREMMPQIVEADIFACNGVIHLVDQVMLPKAKYVDVCDDDEAEIEERPVVPVEDLLTEEEGNCTTYIAETICSEDDLTVLCELVTEYEYYELFDGMGDWTVFAPTDEAFDAILDLTADLSIDEIADILAFHAVQFQTLEFDDLQCKELTEMANGDDSRTKCDKDDVTKERYKIQKGAGQLDGMLPRIIESIQTCNGPIHKVNNVLLPKLK